MPPTDPLLTHGLPRRAVDDLLASAERIGIPRQLAEQFMERADEIAAGQSPEIAAVKLRDLFFRLVVQPLARREDGQLVPPGHDRI